MSKISQELKVLLYLNQKKDNLVTIKEIADYLEISDRQARRYLEDLNNILTIDIKAYRGPKGGYKLEKPLDEGFAIPENMALAMSIAMKRNEKIEKVLSELPNYVITETVVGDNQIDNIVMDNLELLIKAIENQQEISFIYKDFEKSINVQPYKIVFTNHTYYLFATYKSVLKKYDVRLVTDIKTLGSFKQDEKVLKSIKDSLSRYGIINGNKATLKVKCYDLETLLKFEKYFEGKGIKNLEEMTFEVIGNSEHELYYPLFRISTKHYEFLDEEFKNKYIKYLENQIKSINKGVRK